MASSVERYERILAADPRSRVFVELARALIDRGDHERAAGVLESGLVHHPDSAQARILLGQALLGAGRGAEAVAPLEAAVAALPADERARALLAHARSVAAEAVGEPEPAPEAPLPEAQPGAARQDDEPLEVLPGEIVPDDLDLEDLPPEEEIDRSTRASRRAPPLPEIRNGAAKRPPPRAPTAPPVLRRTVTPPPLSAPAEPPPPPENLPNPPSVKKGEAVAEPALPPDPEEAARIAANYERELREKMLAAEPPRAQSRSAAFLFLVPVVAVVAGAAIFWTVRGAHRADEARSAVAAARAGLARDTLGSLREAARALDEARALDPSLTEAVSLSAEVNALLWTDYADEKALERARALATSPAAGEGALAARYLTAPSAKERESAAEALLQASAGSGPLLRVLAAGVLRARGDVEGARLHLVAAAKSLPPMLRALAELGDLARPVDPEEALRFYRLALSAHPTHARSVLGAAEARLALRRNLEESVAEIDAMQKDPLSVPPGTDRLRAEMLRARALFALGKAGEAASGLDAAAARFPGRPEIPAVLAEMEMARGAWDRALAAAERAVRIVPNDAAVRELLAKARLGRGRYRDLLRDTERTSSRALRILRAQAHAELGEWSQARAELEQTRRDGRMPAEAAAWMAVCDTAVGRRAQARDILQSLGAARSQIPAARAAQARLLVADGRAEEAERILREGMDQDGGLMISRVDLALLLRRAGRIAEATEVLTTAVERNPFHPGARLALAALRLEAGNPRAAAEDVGKVLEDRPRDPEALLLLSAARLRLGENEAARSAAQQAVAAAPKDAGAWIAAGRASAALGQTAAARKDLTRAVKLAGRGPRADEARRALARLPKR